MKNLTQIGRLAMRQEGQMMLEIVSDIIESKTGVRPTWGGPTTAPEHERAGEA